MPQQVNLCLPILRKQRRRFAAQSLVQALAVLLLVGGALSAAWVWNLNLASDSLKAVSYTHLDVYKRQGIFLARHHGGRAQKTAFYGGGAATAFDQLLVMGGNRAHNSNA